MVLIILEDLIKYIVFLKFKLIVCVLISFEKVVVLNLQKSEVLFDVLLDKLVFYFGISGIYNCLLFGDEVGSIYFYNVKIGVFFGGFFVYLGLVEKM